MGRVDRRRAGQRGARGPGWSVRGRRAGRRRRWQAQIVAIVSDVLPRPARGCPPATEPGTEPDLLISVTRHAHAAGTLDEVPVISLVGLSETEAVDRLVDRFDGRRPPEPESVIGAMRYPGGDRAQIDEHPDPQRQLHRPRRGPAGASRRTAIAGQRRSCSR